MHAAWVAVRAPVAKLLEAHLAVVVLHECGAVNSHENPYV